jgi:hypothetical protein
VKLTLIFTILLLAPSLALHANAEAGFRHASDWAGITRKRVSQNTAANSESLVKAVAALQPGDQPVIAGGTYSVGRLMIAISTHLVQRISSPQPRKQLVVTADCSANGPSLGGSITLNPWLSLRNAQLYSFWSK